MPGQKKRNTPAVFLGNLRTDIRISILKDNIASLFELIHIEYLRKKHISVINRPYATFCFITVASNEEAETAVSQLSKLFNEGGIPADLLNNLIEPGLSFKVALKTDFAEKAGDRDYLEVTDGDNNEEVIDDVDSNYRASQQQCKKPVYDNIEDYTGQVWRDKKKGTSSYGYQRGFSKDTQSGTASEIIDDEDPKYRLTQQHIKVGEYDNEYDLQVHLARNGTKATSSGYQKNCTKESDSNVGEIIDDEDPNYRMSLSQQFKTTPYDNKDDYETRSIRDNARPISGKTVGASGYHDNISSRDASGGAKGPHLVSGVMSQVPGGAYSDSSLLPKTRTGSATKLKVKRYVMGQKLGSETRNVEYKCGQGHYKDKHFFRHVSVYMSAFLNSEGGTLLIGVDDSGIVQGLKLSHKEEDSLRTKIDVTIKDIRPEVFPTAYSVHFVPVFDNIGKMLKELKVIEIKIKKGESSQLYQTGRGEVYIRRDGSVQELTASAIQEYTRIRVLQELERKGVEMKNLEKQDAELKDQFVVLQQQLADIRIQMSEAENQRLQSLQTEAERDQLQREVQRLSEKVAAVTREKSAEIEKERRLRQELEELRREKHEWQEKGLKRNKSKTCTVC